MASIEIVSRPVYRAPTKGRCYLTPKSAANAEDVEAMRAAEKFISEIESAWPVSSLPVLALLRKRIES